MSSPDRPPGAPRIFIQAPMPPTYTLADNTITLPFPLSLDVLDRLLFLAALQRTGSGRAAAKLLGRSAQWAYERCFELDIPTKNW
jgi:hypothetical protein